MSKLEKINCRVCKALMDNMALHTKLLKRPLFHRIFGKLYAYRIRCGEYTNGRRIKSNGN